MYKVIITPNLLRTLRACAPLIVTFREALQARKKKQVSFTIQELCDLHTACRVSHGPEALHSVAQLHGISTAEVPAWRRNVFRRILQEDVPTKEVCTLLEYIPWLLARVGGDYENMYTTCNLQSVHYMDNCRVSGSTMSASPLIAQVFRTKLTHCTLRSGEWILEKGTSLKNVLARGTSLSVYDSTLEHSTLRGGSAVFYNAKVSHTYFRECSLEHWDPSGCMADCYADEHTRLPPNIFRGALDNGFYPIATTSFPEGSK